MPLASALPFKLFLLIQESSTVHSPQSSDYALELINMSVWRGARHLVKCYSGCLSEMLLDEIETGPQTLDIQIILHHGPSLKP